MTRSPAPADLRLSLLMAALLLALGAAFSLAVVGELAPLGRGRGFWNREVSPARPPSTAHEHPRKQQ